MDIFIGSQNIYDRSGKVIACELLYRNSMVNKYDENISSLSASYSIIKNIIDLGLDIITGGKVALINCDDKILSDDILSILPKDKVFIELLETIKPNKEVLEKIKKLNEHGFNLVLDDVIDLSTVMEFMPYICCVKVDYKYIVNSNKKAVLDFCKHLNIRLLAEKIETEEEYNEALELGFDYFQGYYLDKPKVVKVHDIEFKSSTMYRLLGEITKDRMDLDIIENIMKSDAGLMYKFIRFINSATNGLLRRVSDIKQSIMLIGEEQFKRWVLIFFYSDLSGTDNEKYANKAVVRGRFCELIMSQIDKSKKDDAFICGLLLDINVLLGKNIDEILEEMFMNDEINNALKGESGLIRDVMDIVINYNEMYSKKVEDLCEKLSLDKNTLYKLYLDSILWAKEL